MLFSFARMVVDEVYMNRCLQLAQLGAGRVAPNPMVGALLVHNERIIGEGYHQTYGHAHAEVNCIASVKNEDKHLISQSTLFVSLEPCSHFGKTPPCTDLIVRNNIKKVVVGCRDPFPEVDGKGVENLKQAGIDVTLGLLESECAALNKRFFSYHQQRRPYVTLKWAQSADGKIAGTGKRLHISNEYTNRLVHRWRSEEMAILVGTNTALHDDPELTTRLWCGKNPIRAVVDMNLKLPATLKLFTSGHPTIVFNLHKHTLSDEESKLKWADVGVCYYRVSDGGNLVHQILNGLYQLGIQSLLVEGGRQLLQSFIKESVWDEARVICNQELSIGEGLAAPTLQGHELVATENIFSDTLTFFKNKNSIHSNLHS